MISVWGWRGPNRQMPGRPHSQNGVDALFVGEGEKFERGGGFESPHGEPSKPCPCRWAAPVGQPRRLISGWLPRCPVTATRFLASAKAALVRVEIIFLSAWAITAMMPTTSSLASGMSAATNRTPAFWGSPHDVFKTVR